MRSAVEIREHFLEDLDNWQKIVRDHTLSQLQKQPDPAQWSLGQVVAHVIEVTAWYFLQARKALVDTQNTQKSKSATSTEWFAANSFADERFKGPEDSDEPSQPISVNDLVAQLESLKREVLEMADAISKSGSKGKAEHPGHQFLTALEWFQFAEMHCRHHFRQKERIVAAIKKSDK